MGDESRYRWLLERQLGWIAAADSKAAVLGALPIAMLAVSFSGVEYSLELLQWEKLPFHLGVLFLLLSLWFTKAALTPRTSGPEESVIFFGRVDQFDTDDYVEKVRNQSDTEFMIDLLRQVHRNACIASHKHRQVGRSSLCLAIATPIWFVSILAGG